MLKCVFERFIKVSAKDFGINPLFCVSLPGYSWRCGLKNTGINLQTHQDKDLTLTLENNIRGGISAVLGDRYVKSNENKKYYMRMPVVYMVMQYLNCYLMMKFDCGMVILIFISIG